MRQLRVLTWHVHGSYLYYLSRTGHEIYVPVRPGRPEGYVGLRGSFPWPPTLHEVPIDLVGIDSEEAGGLGDVPHYRLAAFEARYRVFVNPIRYTSLGLAVCEAMMLGMPVAGLATAEMATAVENGVSGFVHTDPRRVVEAVRALLEDAALARRMGEVAGRRARERFGIERFVRDWNRVFAEATGARMPGHDRAEVGHGEAQPGHDRADVGHGRASSSPGARP